MGFIIDKQSLDELNLLGKFRTDSVYYLFNRVKTRGAEQLLDNMFRAPLTDAEAINERINTFRNFQHAAMNFPFDVQQVNLMREYLEIRGGMNPVFALVGACVKRSLALLTGDEQFKKNVQGLQATIITLNTCFAFVSSIRLPTGSYTERVNAIKTLLSDKRLEKLRTTDIYKSLPVKTIAYYNYLLKEKLLCEFEDVLNFIYEVDVYIAVSDVSRAKQFSFATALPPSDNCLEVEELYHPCIEKAIGNGLSLNANNNVLFLTGANMAGKSTLMKSIGIGVYLAHMGFPIAASQMKFSVRDGLYSSINVADNIGLGYSHFYAEVIRVKQAADAAASGKRLLLMFDELFKGTNVKDAYDGTLAVTEAFCDYRACLFIVSTHIIEVGIELQRRSNIKAVFMPTIMEGGTPRYTYKLKSGITEDRQGMIIIQNEGILELLNNIGK